MSPVADEKSMVRSPRPSKAPHNANPARRRAALFAVLTVALATTLGLGCDRAEPAPQAQAIEVATGGEGSDATRPARGASKKGQYTARLEGEAVTVGKPTPVELVVLPGRDLKINLDFPWKFEFKPGEAVAFERTTVARDAMQLEDAHARVPVTVEARQAGPITIEAVGNFSVCNDDRCDILRDEPVVLTLQALEADANPQGAPAEEGGADSERGD